WDERAHLEEIERSDVVVCIGSSLGYETTDTYRLRLEGTLVHIDAAADRIGRSYPALPLVGDAKATLRALLERLPPLERGGRGATRAQTVRERIAAGVADQGRELEFGLLRSIGEALPATSPHAWDSTILAYIAAAHLRVPAPRRFLYPIGSGTLGYAWPA